MSLCPYCKKILHVDNTEHVKVDDDFSKIYALNKNKKRVGRIYQFHCIPIIFCINCETTKQKEIQQLIEKYKPWDPPDFN